MRNDRILIVEDSPTSLHVTRTLLQTHGYQVDDAVDGEEALQKIFKDPPRLVILDVVLPKKNGFQVCRQLRTSPETEKLKILMLTSKTQESDRYWGMRQGADGYLTKPFAEQDLLSHVNKMIGGNN